MDQMNSLAMSMLQTVANTTELPKTGKGGGTDEFQKLLDEKTQEKDSLMEQPSKTQAKPQTPAKKTEKAPAKTEEDPIETSKKAQVIVVGQLDPATLPDPVILENPVTGGELTIIQGDWAPQVWAYESTPEEIAGDPSAIGEGMQMIDVSDPEADAILEATAPGADNSPAAMLEKLVDEEVGQVAQTAVEEVKPQDEDDDQVELVDVEQGPQRVFHDVEAAPVKVGEAEGTEQTNEADVVQQVNDHIAQVIQSGESTVTVRLNPENLGEVTVQVSMKSDGVLNVAISARNDDTRALLERHTAHLQELVSSRTQQSVEVNVQRQQESQQNQNQQSYDGHNGHAQDGQERRQHRQQHTSPEDFMQQLRLGLIPTDGEM